MKKVLLLSSVKSRALLLTLDAVAVGRWQYLLSGPGSLPTGVPGGGRVDFLSRGIS